MSAEAGRCAVCGGSKKSHFDEAGKPITQHVYTEVAGDLKTPRQAAQQALMDGQSRSSVAAGGPQSNASLRVAELLLEKGLLTNDDVVYIVGLGPKPKVQKYRDPSLQPLADGSKPW